jgi:hypothetical protein
MGRMYQLRCTWQCLSLKAYVSLKIKSILSNRKYTIDDRLMTQTGRYDIAHVQKRTSGTVKPSLLKSI